jgi:hypothetical protein
MTKFFRDLQVGYCKACGAKSALINDIVCDSCNYKCENLYGEDYTDLDLSSFLAHRLELSFSRILKYGMANRCEAISHTSNKDQCKRWATGWLYERPVCDLHGQKNNKTVFVDGEGDIYSTLSYQIKKIAEEDDDFKKCLEKALK